MARTIRARHAAAYVAAVAVGQFKLWVADAYTRYVSAPHADYGGIAYQLTFGNGTDPATPPVSIGAPFGGWHITGAFAIASPDTDPTVAGNRTQLYSDTGSIDAAMQVASGLLGGNLHGGITYRSTNVPSAAGKALVIDTGYDADVNWPGGETARIIEGMAVQSDGSLLKTLSYSSVAAFTHVYMSMAIGTGMTQWSNDGITWNTVAYSGSDVTTNLTDNQLIAYMRDPVSGRAIKTEIVSFNTGGRALKRYNVKKSDRLKDYAEFTTGGTPLGTVTVTVKHSFYQTTPDPVASFSPITDPYNGTGTLPAGYTQVSTPSGTPTTALSGTGILQLRVGATPGAPTLRLIRPITGAVADGAKVITVEIDYLSITSQNSVTMYLKSDNGSSTSIGVLPFSTNGAGAANSGNLGASGTLATTVLTFTLPPGTTTPYLMFELNGIATRGADLYETRITQP